MKPSELKKHFAGLLGIQTRITADHNSIQKIIDAVFKNERHKEGYHFPVSEQLCNDTSFTVLVYPEQLDNDEAQLIFSGEWPMFKTEELLREICRRGLIPSGEYLINVSW